MSDLEGSVAEYRDPMAKLEGLRKVAAELYIEFQREHQIAKINYGKQEVDVFKPGFLGSRNVVGTFKVQDLSYKIIGDNYEVVVNENPVILNKYMLDYHEKSSQQRPSVTRMLHNFFVPLIAMEKLDELLSHYHNSEVQLLMLESSNKQKIDEVNMSIPDPFIPKFRSELKEKIRREIRLITSYQLRD